MVLDGRIICWKAATTESGLEPGWQVVENIGRKGNGPGEFDSFAWSSGQQIYVGVTL
jgi:hypothetical protein